MKLIVVSLILKVIELQFYKNILIGRWPIFVKNLSYGTHLRSWEKKYIVYQIFKNLEKMNGRK